MKKRDIILVVSLLVVAGIVFLIFNINNKSGKTVVITENGSTYGTYSLSENKVIDIKTDLGHNKVVIKDSKVHMEEADCPDKYCVDKGEISKTNESLICLPHKLVVEITDD
ncbi:NusG domain II-containing protein, partial [Ruminococcus sp.]